MLKLKINQPSLQKELQRLLRPHADAGGAFLMDAISQPGEGVHHEGNPYPSSAVGDYPTFQTGALMESLDVRQSGPLEFQIGFFSDMNAEGFEHAVELESRPPEQGGRYPIMKAWGDPEFRKAVLTGKGP